MSSTQNTNTSAIVSYNNNGNEGSPKQMIALDSLPYIDYLHPDYEAYALALVEEEMQRMQNNNDVPSDGNRLQHLSNPLKTNNDNVICHADTTPAFKSSRINGNLINIIEYESLVERQGQPRSEEIMMELKNTINVKSTKPTSNNVEEWKEAIQKAKAELEYERLRMVNLEVQSEYETSIWKHQTKNVEMLSNHVKSILLQQQQRVDEINAKRQHMQVERAQPRLSVLNQKWDEGLKRVLLLKHGVDKLKNEVEDLRQVTGVSFQNDNLVQEDDDDDDL